MRILVVGQGVIGTVYAAHLARAGHEVGVLRHGQITAAEVDLTAVDVLSGQSTTARVPVVSDASSGMHDLILVAVRAEQVAAAARRLTSVPGDPTVLFFGNNPAGHASLPDGIAGTRLGFPGIGRELRDGAAHYLRIRQQPTALQAQSPTGPEPCARRSASSASPRTPVALPTR